MNQEMLKEVVRAGVEVRLNELVQLSQLIHSHPELGFQEHQAVEWLTSYLREQGFSVKTKIADLPTAFRADYGTGRPVIAFLAEYDALPKIGHACGHNIIATSAVGAAVALRPVVDEWGGQVVVMGTPAEELYGGKAIMAEKGAFAGLDAAMMFTPVFATRRRPMPWPVSAWTSSSSARRPTPRLLPRRGSMPSRP